MRKTFLSSLFLCFGLLIASLFFGQKAHAAPATINNLSDTITTSRPSASAPLAANKATNDTSVQIVDNGSIFLASDSAQLYADTGETGATAVVASTSAQNVPSSGKRIVFFSSTSANNTHHQGDPIYTAITAMHTIQFYTPTQINSTDTIRITFPGTTNTTASPSATTFPFNGLTTANASSNISYKLGGGSINCTFAVATSGNATINCVPASQVNVNTSITFLIGCADSSNNATACTTQSPRLINPTKTASAGTADIWSVKVQVLDSNSEEKAVGTTKIGTIESVLVVAMVEPAFTFAIANITNGSAINTGNTIGCSNTETSNTGVTPSTTSVDLGAVGPGINIAAQRITIATNAMNGYSLTATSSGNLINPATGFWINSSTSPGFMTAATTWFGVHPCGMDVTTGTWGTGVTGGGSGAKYGWPTQTTSVTLANDTSGPIYDNSNGNGITSIEYGITVSSAVPAANYSAYITYVATPTF